MAHNKRIGYIRVSTFEQNPGRQLEGILLDKKYIDKVSGKDTNRPKLQELLEYAREGDVVIVHSMDRLARNSDDLKRLVQFLTTKDVTVQFIKEGLTFTGEDSPMSQLMLTVLGAVAQFEYALISERRMEGIALAKQKGAYKGRKPVLNNDQVSDIKIRLANGDKKSQIARDMNICRETLYKYLRQASVTESKELLN